MSTNVFCVMLEQPNGISEIYFDDHDHMCHAQEAFRDMLLALKSSDSDDGEKELHYALSELETAGYLMRYMEYPGACMEQFEISQQINGEPFRMFDGDPYRIDSIIMTDVPIR